MKPTFSSANSGAHRRRKLRLDLVVGVDHADQLARLVDHALEGIVERARLVTGPIAQVDEFHVVLSTPRLDRAPQPFVVGVVVENLDLVVRIVEGTQRGQRLDDHLWRLVVTGDLEADEWIRTVRHLGELLSPDPAHPAGAAKRVAELPQIGATEARGDQLE